MSILILLGVLLTSTPVNGPSDLGQAAINLDAWLQIRLLADARVLRRGMLLVYRIHSYPQKVILTRSTNNASSKPKLGARIPRGAR